MGKTEVKLRGRIGEKRFVGKQYDFKNDNTSNITIALQAYRPFIVESVVNFDGDETAKKEFEAYLKGHSNTVLSYPGAWLEHGGIFMLMHGVKDEDEAYPELELSGELNPHPSKKRKGLVYIGEGNYEDAGIEVSGDMVVDETSYTLLKVNRLEVFSIERKRQILKEQEGRNKT